MIEPAPARPSPLVLLAVLLVAIARPFLPVHPISLAGSYEAFSHLLVGGLIGGWLVKRNRWLLRCIIGLSVVELVCATLGAIGVL